MGNTNNGTTVSESHLSKIKEALQSIQYGTVTIVVQDGKIIQIDKTEKYRVRD